MQLVLTELLLVAVWVEEARQQIEVAAAAVSDLVSGNYVHERRLQQRG